MLSLEIEEHPFLEHAAFLTHFPLPLGQVDCELQPLLNLDFAAPMASSDHIRKTVRDLLRAGGFKPTGRSKPASEYLIKAADSGFLGPINAAVDACNVASLHSGLPISVVDADTIVAPLSLGLAPSGARYVFNPSGQEIDIGGLLCLHDAEGPCANAVKDSQRTKTHEDTTTVLAVVWGSQELPGRALETATWMRSLLEACGARCESV